ncbi:MAG: response regulator [bacterium]|nr:response regulator [bacterium]
MKHILLVEDDPGHATLISRAFQAYSNTYRLTIVGSLQEAKNAIERAVPDLVITDLLLPDGKGIHLLDFNQEERSFPVVLMTSFGSEHIAVEAIKAGALDYVVKSDITLVDMPHIAERSLREWNHIVRRKDAESSLRRLNAELEQRVGERTAALAQSNKELKDFAHIISHDLKAPLRGIRRLNEWILKDYAGAVDEKGQELFALLTEQVQHMNRLIDGILRYSRAGHFSENVETLDLHTLIQELLHILDPPVRIHVAIEGQLPRIVGDRVHLNQIFQNLLNNAIKFMDKPEGLITVSCRDRGFYWEFAVADNGPGIAQQHHERIFQIFQCVDRQNSSEINGIGLAIVKKLVSFYGGAIRLESQPGEGSVFYFTMPKGHGHLSEEF